MSAVGGGGVEVAAMPLLFSSVGSKVALVAVAMLTKKVPGGVAGGIWKTNVKSADSPAARVAIEHEIVPPEPTGGSEQVKTGPLFWVLETKVIPGGIGSLRTAEFASSGPELVMVTSKE